MDIIRLPKIELHCHLDGSVRPETIKELAKEVGIKLPTDQIEGIRDLMVAPMDCQSLKEYLMRFDLPVKLMQTKSSLERVAYEVMEDAAKENIKYMEIRFAPLHHVHEGLSVIEVIESVIRGVKKAEDRFDIQGNLILSCLRHSPVETTYDVIEAGKAYLGNGVVAFDLAAAEEPGFCLQFVEPVALARQYGYRITIHAGEQGVGQNVYDAIQLLGAERIGHGIYIRNHKEAYELVKDKGIYLEMCPTSNVQTKAVSSFEEHPIKEFLKDGIGVTINTDNRTVSNTTMSNEIDVVDETLGLTLEEYRCIYLYSVEAAFVEEEMKERLRAKL
ncbi:adenosine deaminase [Vallitalea okinawensis]|uniref:adenosine deaminase n=1 Tax=Vallitalea okinawensis TaxID=2078660 RepID=UPI000CFB4CB9|nr:adenosine deaminase [Vallitalea okinawensis]